MGRRDDLIISATAVLHDRCGLAVDRALVAAVIDGCGPAIYGAGQGDVDPSNRADMAAVRRNYLSAKLGFPDDPDLDDVVATAVETFGPADGETISKPVLYYLLAVQMGAQDYYS